MAELLGRIERIAATGGAQQQIAGQGQVKPSIIFHSQIIDRLKFRLYRVM
jgi:hypothetical protein